LLTQAVGAPYTVNPGGVLTTTYHTCL
jgi:hypothetical protein